MKIVAQQGDRVYLIETDVATEMGRVLSLDDRKLYPPFNIHAILKQGYWEPFQGSQTILPRLLDQVEDLPTPSRNHRQP